jgi:Anti-sigma factor NepR
MIHSAPPPAYNRADRHRQKVIGRGLTRLYASPTLEPIPEDFLHLLADLDSKRGPDRSGSK